MRQHEHGDMSKTTVTVTPDLLARLDEMGERGESYEDVIRRVVGLPARDEVVAEP